MRTALVHDWLTGMRGGEKVLELLCEILPGSDLYTLIHTPGSVSEVIENRRVVSSWLNRLPGVANYYRYLLPLMPMAAHSLKLRGYDLVVAVSHCVAHGVDVPGDTRFVCYCLTPMRYIWDTLGAYFPGRRRRDTRYRVLRRLSSAFRRWDRAAAERVTEYISISDTIRERVRNCYGVDSPVIFPPVDTGFYNRVGAERTRAYLWVGALAPYKRIDIALEAFAELGSKFVVIGEGQDYSWARKNAPANVTFLGQQPDEVLREYYSKCRALIFPGNEDFGIVPCEAQACGCPVIAYGSGGVLDTVVPLDADSRQSPTGVFFSEQSPGSLADAVRRFESAIDRFDAEAIRKQALKFRRERCRRELSEYLLG